MISTRLYELVHTCRSKGQMNAVLPVSLSDFDQLLREMKEMNCLRALKALNQPLPTFAGLIISIEADCG
ncbi:MAG: hypothetical protein OQK12_08295 [Motiliproteus sp.]|nr:hypothetical protein [Motiliproteus sp.]MCW9052100.1 hypothetical protein [Motiliproteus sp.]